MKLEKTLQNLHKTNKDYRWSIIKDSIMNYNPYFFINEKIYLHLEGLPESKFNSFYNDYNWRNRTNLSKIDINLYKNYRKILNGKGFLWSFDLKQRIIKINLDYYNLIEND
jgi:hypothetical protein